MRLNTEQAMWLNEQLIELQKNPTEAVRQAPRNGHRDAKEFAIAVEIGARANTSDLFLQHVRPSFLFGVLIPVMRRRFNCTRQHGPTKYRHTFKNKQAAIDAVNEWKRQNIEYNFPILDGEHWITTELSTEQQAALHKTQAAAARKLQVNIPDRDLARRIAREVEKEQIATGRTRVHSDVYCRLLAEALDARAKRKTSAVIPQLPLATLKEVTL